MARSANTRARGLLAPGRTVHRRRDGVVAIRRAGRFRRALPLLAEGAALLVPLVLALAFVLPPALLPIPPLLLALAVWLPVGARRPAARGGRTPVIAIRPGRALPPPTSSPTGAARTARPRDP